ncbi:hypothetical protein HKCCE2091_15915 [Rhodobacterales bacterium HKCCE2091]|nr:hypothetical protein [Rhodobacterales bacterium HKCCE2091]
MTGQDPCAWHIHGLLDINTTLDVSPVGRHERDEIGKSEEELRAYREAVMASGRKFDGLDPITIDDLGGPVWAFRRIQPEKPGNPAALSLGRKPAVSPACKAVLEQADLGAVDFHRIEVLNMPRNAAVWPELYVMHVRNAKQSIDVKAQLAAGCIIDANAGREAQYGKPFPPMLRFGDPRKLTLLKNALEGPDLWRETQLSSGHRQNLFMSTRLRDLLDAAGMLKPWGVRRAPIVPAA